MRLSILVGMSWLAIAAIPGRTWAQPEPSDVGVFFDRYENPTSTWAPPYTTNNQAFVKVFQPIGGYQLAMEIDPRLIVFAFSAIYPDDDYGCGWTSSDRIECTRSLYPCYDPSDPPLEYLTYIEFIAYGYWDAEATGMTICLGPTDPSLLDPPMPSYLTCVHDEWIPFTLAENGMGAYPDGCGVVNPTAEPPVAGQDVSWSALKARFDVRGER
jgi:hypothetical protein